MTGSEKAPIFNLKAVVRQTGLKPDTLRAWERRYGLPSPQRTESGHRLYSQHDVEIIKWLTERQSEGLSIGRAIDLWHQLDQEQGDPLDSDFSVPAVSSSIPVRSDSDEQPHSQVDQLRNQWVKASLDFDEQAAEEAMAQAFALFSPEVVCMKILQAGLAEIGEGWHQGRITVQQEHFASALALRRLESMLTGMAPPTRPGRVIIGCPAEEEHTFVPLMLAVLLRRRGYDVVYLGANIPLRSMELTLDSTRPKLIILTAQQLFTAASLLDTGQLLEQQGIPLAYGGLIFRRIPELTKVIPGYYLGDHIDASLQLVEQILVAPQVRSALRPIAIEYVEAHDHFRHHQSEIEAVIWQQMGSHEIPSRQLDTANLYMGRNIRAALKLGSMDHVILDLVWIEEMLVQYYEMPSAMVHSYLQLYYEAAAQHLDERGSIVVQWLANLLQENSDLTRSSGQTLTLNEQYGSHRVSMNNR